MRLLRAFCIAFSLYSRIPVPIFEWKEEDMQYSLMFFPWVGIVIGGLLFGWNQLASRFGIGEIGRVAIAATLPIVVTGGFHIDGYMDTMDAFHSYKPKDEKLRILQDPHIGAFAVIQLALLVLVFVGAFSQIRSELVPVFAGSFFLARCLSGITVILLPSAKNDGLVHTFASAVRGGAKKLVLAGLILEFALSCTLMMWQNLMLGGALVATALLVLVYYMAVTKKNLGGVTGDTSGYFVCIMETAMAVVAAIFSVLCGSAG